VSDLDGIIAGLEQAKLKLVDARSKGLRACEMLGRATQTVGHTLGRAGSGSPLLAQMRGKEKSILAQVMALNALIARVDAAIAETRGAAGGGGGGPRPAPG